MDRIGRTHLALHICILEHNILTRQNNQAFVFDVLERIKMLLFLVNAMDYFAIYQY